MKNTKHTIKHLPVGGVQKASKRHPWAHEYNPATDPYSWDPEDGKNYPLDPRQDKTKPMVPTKPKRRK